MSILKPTDDKPGEFYDPETGLHYKTKFPLTPLLVEFRSELVTEDRDTYRMYSKGLGRVPDTEDWRITRLEMLTSRREVSLDSRLRIEALPQTVIDVPLALVINKHQLEAPIIRKRGEGLYLAVELAEFDRKQFAGQEMCFILSGGKRTG